MTGRHLGHHQDISFGDLGQHLTGLPLAVPSGPNGHSEAGALRAACTVRHVTVFDGLSGKRERGVQANITQVEARPAVNKGAMYEHLLTHL